MTIAEPMLLPSDVELVPVDDLPDEVRAQIEHRPGDHALTRPRSRTPSSIVDANTARLLGAFRTPTRIVDAVISFATEERLDPRETLARSYPVLKDLLGSGLLVPADSELAHPIEPQFAEGDAIGPFSVIRAVHLMIDTDLYLARDADGAEVAVKVARRGSEAEMRPLIARESSLLTELNGAAVPRVVALGEHDGRPYLAIGWHRGVDVATAAGELRDLPRDRGRTALLTLGRDIIGAYAGLHRRGFLHGDVHPNNVIVGPDGRATLIDFGLAARIGDATAPRGGVDFFMAPEASTSSPGTATEQYSVASMLFYLLTGTHTHDFALEPAAMARQLADDPPASFGTRGVDDLPRTETVVRRALAKSPADRFADLDALAEAWTSAAAADLGDTRIADAVASTDSIGKRREAFVADVLGRLALDGPLLATVLTAPRASVNLGAAGIAGGLLRVACARDDERVLALADVWLDRAYGQVGTDEAFVNRDLDITPEEFGTAGIHHSLPGVHATAAAIAAARDDELARSAAVAAYCSAAADPGAFRDVSFGTAGILLGAATLLEIGATGDPERTSLLELGHRLAAEAWADLSATGAIGRPGQPAAVRHLGAAHGWGGMLYAQLRWAAAAGRDLPGGLADRLDELARLGVPLGRGLVWPREIGAPDDGSLSSSWCNGAAGLVPLWILAADSYADHGFDAIAEAAAWTAFDGPSGPGDLCCGLSGRAYALLALHRAGGDRSWLDRATILADRSPRAVRESALRRDSLYKGEVGVAALLADLERPEDAAMPYFGRGA